MTLDITAQRFGSAGFADYRMRKAAGLCERRGAYMGTDDVGRYCYSDQQSAIRHHDLRCPAQR